VVQRMTEVGQPILDKDPLARGWFKFANAVYLGYMEPETWLQYENARDSVSAFTEGDALRCVSYGSNVLGNALVCLGRWKDGEQHVRHSVSLASRLNDVMMMALARSTFVRVLANHPDAAVQDEVFRIGTEQLGRPRLSPIHTSMVLGGMVRLLIRRGNFVEAERMAREMLALLAVLPSLRLPAYALLAWALLPQGHVKEARSIAEEGAQLTSFIGGYSENSLDVKLALAEARHADQDLEGAHGALRETVAEIDLRASKITELDFRESFLTQVPLNVRIRELAASWLS
jgi:eukaryotic-like serine/threonine-protein kinase